MSKYSTQFGHTVHVAHLINNLMGKHVQKPLAYIFEKSSKWNIPKTLRDFGFQWYFGTYIYTKYQPLMIGWTQ